MHSRILSHSYDLVSVVLWLQGSGTELLQISCHILLLVVASQWPYVRSLPPREHRANASWRNPLWYYFHRTSARVATCARLRASAVYTRATFCRLNSSRVAHRIKRHARFFSLPFSQTEQEMRKLKINPIKNNYFLPRWMCSTCVRADNTFNNPASLLICVEMVFKFSKRSKWSKYKKSSWSYWGGLLQEKCRAGGCSQ